MNREKNMCINFDLVSKVLGILAAAALAMAMLTGCSLVDEDTDGCGGSDGGNRSGSAIAFAVDGGDSTTRTRDDSSPATRTAEGTMTIDGTGGTESLRERGFGVFACHTGVHPYVSTSTTANLMWNQLVSYNTANALWEYAPLVYWPNGESGLDAYVTFFAYAPHSDHAGGCIAGMSNAEDVGDPWIVYQLGGGEQAEGSGGWKARQVDLVYDFRKDCSRGTDKSKRVDFSFKHALASIGDQVTVGCATSIINALSQAYQGTPLTFVLKRFTLDYVLTRKGRLVLNSAGQPNWQAVDSEDSKVHRFINFEPEKRMAYIDSPTYCSTYEYQTDTGHGVFYIPLDSGGEKQRIVLTAECAIRQGDSSADLWTGEVTTSVDLLFGAEASRGRNLHVTLPMPQLTCGGTALAEATVGQVICSHGRAHDATQGMLPCLGRKVAVVASVAPTAGEGGYTHGLAIALNDAPGQTAWCSNTASVCLGSQVTAVNAAITMCNGLACTDAHADHAASATALAAAYQYADGVAAGSHPEGTSRWFLPSVGQWNLIVKGLTELSDNLSGGENSDYLAADVSRPITAAGGTALRGEANQLYWTATESSETNAWYVSFEKGKTQSTAKTTAYYVRPVLAF